MAASWYAGDLPTFEEVRRETLRQLGDAADTLRSDWREQHLTVEQADALAMARQHITLAKTQLDKAAAR